MGFNTTPLISSTIDKWVEQKFMDNVSARVPLVNWFKNKGRIKSWDGSGVYIEEPALADYDTGRVQAMDKYSEIDLTPESGQKLIPFSPKVIVNSVMISYEERDANSGEAKMIDLLESKMEQAELEIGDKMEEWLHSDGTAEGGLVPLGLSAIISATPTSGTICGYDRSAAANAWIRNQAVSGAKTTDAYDNLRKKMNNLYNTCSRGVIHPELLLTSQTIFEAYVDLYYDKFLFQDQEMANLGFDNVKFRKAALSWSDQLSTSTSMYFLNSWALRFRSRTTGKSIFKTYPMVDLMDVNKMRALSKIIEWQGALTFNMPRTLGVLYSIS